MDLEIENYEADIADLKLQDSPFYEATTPTFLFDLSMSNANRITLVRPTPVTAGKLSGKCAVNMIENTVAYNGNQSGGHVNALPHDANTYRFTSKFDEPPKKKNRKCVSFLPNYVQVSD